MTYPAGSPLPWHAGMTTGVVSEPEPPECPVCGDELGLTEFCPSCEQWNDREEGE